MRISLVGIGAMKIDSSIDSNRIRANSVRVVVHGILSLLILGAALLLSEIVEKRNSESLLSSLRAIFRNDQTVGNTALFSRRIADLERLKIIECVKIQSAVIGEIYNTTFKEECSRSILFGQSNAKVTGQIEAYSGDSYSISFVASRRGGYVAFYGLFWLLGLVSINGALGWYWRRTDDNKRRLVREENHSRILEERVRQQSDEIAAIKINAAVRESLVQLATQVSHDIRSPLSAINLVARSLGSIEAEKRDVIEHAVTRINGIAGDLLKRYKDLPVGEEPENAITTTEELALASHSITKIATAVCLEKRATMANDGRIGLVTDFGVDMNFHVHVDEKELSRALSNLVNNSIESIERTGTVTIAVRAGRSDVSLVVADDGCGIPDDVLQKLGEARMSFGKSGMDGGTGLGVLHAKRVVEAMRGRFLIQSRIGMGTIVTMSFPRAQP